METFYQSLECLLIENLMEAFYQILRMLLVENLIEPLDQLFTINLGSLHVRDK